MPERRQQMMMGKWHYQVINVRPDNRFPDNKPKPQMNGELNSPSPARRHVAVNDLAVNYSSPNWAEFIRFKPTARSFSRFAAALSESNGVMSTNSAKVRSKSAFVE